MKKFNIIPAILLAFTPLFTNAQQGINQTPLHTGGARGQIMTSGEKPLPATGTMYTYENYTPARISGNDQIILVKYNAYSDYFEMTDGGNPKVLPKQGGIDVTLTNTGEVYSLQRYKTDDDEMITGYLNVVSDNSKVKIYKRERIYLKPGRTSVNSYSTSKPATYKRADDEFYVKINDGEAVFVSNKKDVAKLIPGKSKEVIDFIKKNKIDLDEEIDLQQLSSYLETIL